MNGTNLFSALNRYDGSRSAENYLTEAFAFLLRALLEEERAKGVQFLNRLCGTDEAFAFSADDRIAVETQRRTEDGQPDIAICAADTVAYVEVKKEARPHDGQLPGYVRALRHSGAMATRLVVLTRYRIEVPASICQPVHCVRWFQVRDWLTAAGFESDVARYLATQFSSFLEENGMAIERISWELAPGAVALRDFTKMLLAAIEAAGIEAKVGTVRGTDRYIGCMIDSPKYWLGVSYRRPFSLYFQICRTAPEPVFDYLQRTYGHLPPNEYDEGFYLQLESESTCFFSLSKERQLEVLKDFIKMCHDRVKDAEQRAADAGEGEPAP